MSDLYGVDPPANTVYWITFANKLTPLPSVFHGDSRSPWELVIGSFVGIGS